MIAAAAVQTLELLERPVVDVGWLDLALAVALVLVAVGLSRWQRLGLARDFVVGAVRTVVQLTLVGYALVYIFALDRWYLVVGALLLMLAVAAQTAAARQGEHGRGLFPLMGAALLIGAGLTLVYVGAVVVRADPWYNPRYLIPLFGMIVGYAMNAAALAAERLRGELQSRRAEVEAMLALGAAPERAARSAVQRAMSAAMIPTLNSLMVVGIVSLPGMMTGQIIAGSSPLLAVRYQIMVMFMLAAAVAVSVACVAIWYRDRFFTAAQQLRLTE